MASYGVLCCLPARGGIVYGCVVRGVNVERRELEVQESEGGVREEEIWQREGGGRGCGAASRPCRGVERRRSAGDLSRD